MCRWKRWCCLLLLLYYLEGWVLTRYPSLQSHPCLRQALRKFLLHARYHPRCGLRLSSICCNNELLYNNAIYGRVLPKHLGSDFNGTFLPVHPYLLRPLWQNSHKIWRVVCSSRGRRRKPRGSCTKSSRVKQLPIVQPQWTIWTTWLACDGG